MSSAIDDPAERQRLARQYRDYGRFEMTTHGSPIYAAICTGLADDPEVGDLALHAADGFRTPLILLAAVHYLLLTGLRHPLGEYYPTISGDAARPIDDGLYPAFRGLASEHRDAVRVLVSTRTTQTNEARRSVITLPALGLVAREAARPLALLEVGASAGLNLLADRFGFSIGGVRCGDRASPVQIECAVEGDLLPPVPAAFPTVAWRAGLDLNPLTTRDPDTLAWLRALVWPEHLDRLEVLEGAAGLARTDPPRLLRGDLADDLPALAAQAPRDAALVVIGTWVLTYVPLERRHEFIKRLAEVATRRGAPVWLASCEAESIVATLGVGIGQPPADGDGSADFSALSLHRFEPSGASVHALLASCHAHGRWMRWLDSGTARRA